MADIVIYHNPQCSKSRGALDILREAGVAPDVIEYKKDPPDRAALEAILDAIGDEPSELVRRDPKFSELGLGADDVATREGVLDVLEANPELMQRPVVLRGKRGVIGRPPEKVSELL